MTKSKEILDLTQQSFTSEDLPSIWEQVETEQREFVDLSYNQSTISHLNLPAHKLQSVRFLYLYQSNIESIDIDGDLPNLKILHLGGNQLKEFSLPSGFGALEYLRLDDNQLTEIDLKDLVLDNLKGKNSLKSLFLKENKVANVPQEILEQDENCLKQVQVYYKAIEDTGIGHDNEVKVILVGNGSVGKTQIAKRLEKPEENRFDTDHKSTHAIVLWQRKLKGTHLKEGLVLNIWDFGGQDIYHATHRMFMQTNALFLLVWDSKNEKDPQHLYNGRWYDNKKLDYWLKYVACFGKGSPVLLLQNKMDRAGEEEMERYDKKKYQRDYPNIKGFLKLSA